MLKKIRTIVAWDGFRTWEKIVACVLVCCILGIVLFSLWALQEPVAIQQQQGTHVSEIVIAWDRSVEVTSPTAIDHVLSLDFELRQDGTVVATQSTTSDCQALLDVAGAGQCGAALSVTWGDLSGGAYQVWVRGTWVPGDHYLELEPATTRDEAYFWLVEEFQADYVYYLPIVMKAAP